MVDWTPSFQASSRYDILKDVDSVAVFIENRPAFESKISQIWIRVHRLLPGTGSPWDRLGERLFSFPRLNQFGVPGRQHLPRDTAAILDPATPTGDNGIYDSLFTIDNRVCGPTRVWDGYRAIDGPRLKTAVGSITNTDPCAYWNCGKDVINDGNGTPVYEAEWPHCCTWAPPVCFGTFCWCSFGLIPCCSRAMIDLEPRVHGVGPAFGESYFQYACCRGEGRFEVAFPQESDISLKVLIISYFVAQLQGATLSAATPPLCCLRKENQRGTFLGLCGDCSRDASSPPDEYR